MANLLLATVNFETLALKGVIEGKSVYQQSEFYRMCVFKYFRKTVQ